MSFCMYVYPSIGLHVCLAFWLYIYLSIYLYVCLSTCMYACLSVCLHVYMSVCPSVCLNIYLYVCLSVCLSVYLPICLAVRLFVWISIYMSDCLYYCLSVWCLSSCLLICLSVCHQTRITHLNLFSEILIYYTTTYQTCFKLYSADVNWGKKLENKVKLLMLFEIEISWNQWNWWLALKASRYWSRQFRRAIVYFVTE